MDGQTARRVERVLIWFTAGACLFSVALVFGGPYAGRVALRFILHKLPFMGTTFAPGAWAAGGDCTGLGDWRCQEKWMKCERGPMLRTLMRRHLRIGETHQADVIARLGKYDHTVERDAQMCLRYQLGYCSGLGIDMDYVEICFDGDGVLSSKRRHRG